MTGQSIEGAALEMVDRGGAATDAAATGGAAAVLPVQPHTSAAAAAASACEEASCRILERLPRDGPCVVVDVDVVIVSRWPEPTATGIWSDERRGTRRASAGAGGAHSTRDRRPNARRYRARDRIPARSIPFPPFPTADTVAARLAHTINDFTSLSCNRCSGCR